MIYLFFKFLPFFAGFIAIGVGILVVVLLFFGLFIIALPILFVLFLIFLIVKLFKIAGR